MPTPTRVQTGQDLIQHPPFTFRWAEYIGSAQGCTQTYRFAQDSSQASITIDINGDDFNDTTGDDPIGQIVGYSYAYSTLGDINLPRYFMSRFPPCAHPIRPWMYAVEAGPVTGIKPVGKAIGLPIMLYERYRVPITYSTPNYTILTDDQLNAITPYDESNRYVIKQLDTSADSIAIDGAFFRFAEGAADNPLGQQFTLGQSKILVKVNLRWTWLGVPERYLFNKNGLPVNINAALGTVNLNTIWGYPAGTLLMLPAKFTPRTLPVSPLLLKSGPVTSPPRVWDVEFQFKYWNPPLGPGASHPGHNNAMWVADQLFYFIKSTPKGQPSGAPLGQPLFQSTDFSTIFNGVAVNS